MVVIESQNTWWRYQHIWAIVRSPIPTGIWRRRRPDEEHRGFVQELFHWRPPLTLLAPHIAAFLQQRLPIERRASPNTCDSYAHAFRLLFEYASRCVKLPASQLQPEQLDAPLIVNFLNHLETTRGNGAGSRNIGLAAIKSFLHYMEYRVPSVLEPIQRVLAIPAKKAHTRVVRHLTAQEMQSVLDAPDPTIGDGIRDRAMLHLCFAGGLRVSELVGLRMEDMVLQPQASVLVHGNGEKSVASRCGEKRHPLSVPGYPSGV